MILNIFDTTFMRIYSKQDFKDLSNFIRNNRSQITLTEDLKLLFKEDRLSISPIMKMYIEFKDMLFDKYNIFTLINIPDNINSSIPSLLTQTATDIDTMMIKSVSKDNYNILCTFPEFTDKIIANVSLIYDSKNNRIRNISDLATRVVKAVFIRKYITTKSNGWLSSSLLLPLIEIYSFCVSYNIARVYNLSYIDQKIVAIILAIYFTQKCFANEGKFIPLYKQIRRLGNMVEINSIERQIIDNLNGEKELTTDDICKLISNLGPEHIHNFSEEAFFKLGRTYHINNPLSLISIEYPPLWLYNIITSVSGENKSNMYWSLQKTRLLNEAKSLVSKLEKSIEFDVIFENH